MKPRLDRQIPEKELSPQTIQKVEARERKQAIRKTFWAYCRGALFTEQGKQALAYVIQRGFTDSQIEAVDLFG